ncbi:MAG TPA: type I DNA topoisomerase [Thermodesulfovibrionales bacterium]|nr:type I DNA topoisomerase [Thermodesulfovibrionales bacterium]
MKSLVIVESPAKANTIHKILGKEYSVKASVGHIRDLPKKEMGVDVGKDFEPHYVTIPGKEKVIRELRKAAKEADRVYLAPDPDREGEAIAWHIASVISDPRSKGREEKLHRVTFNEITERAVLEAIKNPKTIDTNKVDAQQARRILDRLVGYGLSPLLWKKVRRGLSAGRVQSVAVKLVVDREREIDAFQKEEYWNINLQLEGPLPPQFPARLYKYENSLIVNREAEGRDRFLIRTEEDAQRLVNEIGRRTLSVSKVEKKERKRSPYAPFTTSTLQQEAARKLRYTAKKTMMLSQQLYEGVELGDEGSVGLITYMRTDAVRVAPEAQEWAREYIEKRFGKEYAPEKPPYYKSKSGAQEAHEAIRPTDLKRPPQAVKQFLSRDQYSLYTLIWNRFIASQMASSRLEQTTFIIENPEKTAEIRASGTVVRFDGFMALYTESKDEIEEEEGGILPLLKAGDALRIIDMKATQHFTQPPPRYTEATLVKALEEKGIGRPSTYAAILSTIQDRKYVHKVDGRFTPTELGSVVNDLLVERFPELIDIGFTAKMEGELDSVEEGEMNWVEVVKDFYKPFSHDLSEATKTMGKIKPADIPTDVMCEKCGMPMVIKWGRHGRFMACSGYPNCKNTRPLEGQGTENSVQATDEKCEVCGSPMVLRSGRFGKFLACSRYPECKTTKPLSTGVKCPDDGGDIVERRTKKGKLFWSCNNYPKCTFATWNKPLPKKCPNCGADFLCEKRDKTGQTIIFCSRKECGYTEKGEEKPQAEEPASIPL